MEGIGLVERIRSREDERQVLIRLTEKGEALKEKAFEVPEKLFCQSGLTIEEFFRMKADLGGLLERLRNHEERLEDHE
jgi:DNA-binding MarR family transcriptional regulator